MANTPVVMTSGRVLTVLYAGLVVFGATQAVQASVTSLAKLIGPTGVYVWAVGITMAAALAILGAWVAPTRAREGAGYGKPQVMEIVGAVLLGLALLLYHYALRRNLGPGAVLPTQDLLGIVWALPLARAGQVSIEAWRARRARTRGTTVTQTMLGSPPTET